jgi:hypothetical protein
MSLPRDKGPTKMSQSFIDTGRSPSSFPSATAPDGSYTVTEKLFAQAQHSLSLQPQPCGCIVAGSTSHVCPAHPQLALHFVRGGDAE